MKRSLLVVTALAGAVSLYGTAARADTLAHTFMPTHGDPQDFVVSNIDSGAIQLGLEAQPRGVGNPLAMSGNTYYANPGFTLGGTPPSARALWNFDFSIDTDPSNSASPAVTLSDITASMSVTGPNGVSGTFYPFTPGDNDSTGEGAPSTLAQNSENLGFDIFGTSAIYNSTGLPLVGFNPDAPGTYTFTLTIDDLSGSILGTDTINVDVVPLPASAWSGLALLGGLAAFGGFKRLRNQLA